MKIYKIIITWVVLFTALQSSAQTDFLGFSGYIQNAVQNSFPDSALRSQLISQVPQAVGNNGDAIVTGVDSNGNLIGQGAAGATTASTNIEISSGVISTNVTWMTTVTWNSFTYGDGYVYIKVTITWGNSSANYSRVIDVRTSLPNTTAVGSSGPVPTVFTGTGVDYRGETGYYQLQSVPTQYSYWSNGVFYVVATTAWVWVWVATDGSGQPYNEQQA
jgi:hypothetical protein